MAPRAPARRSAAPKASVDPLAPARAYFAQRGWAPFAFQEEAWSAYLAGLSGLVHAPTGMGKTLSVWMGPLLEARADADAAEAARAGDAPASALRVLWLTPLRALAADVEHALREAAAGVGLAWRIEQRTGDTPAALRARQRRQLPEALITTPESLSLLLSYPDHQPALAGVRAVIVDEWHELLGSKRGLLAELGLARLRRLAPAVRTWGLSATLGNLDQARDVLMGVPRPGGPRAVTVRGLVPKPIRVDTLIPRDVERFPWAGHLGIRQLPGVLEALERARTTLLFTNTRSQTEIWFQSILKARPDWLGAVALHHGSLDRDLRARVEDGLRAGSLRCVVCTSSLDLGVDFRPVDQVIQVGSPKGVARLLQRAGRSGHQPGQQSRVLGVPTNALELVEFAAARSAIEALHVESRPPLTLALDVLAQHLVTLASGPGFDPDDLLAELRTTHAFAALTREQFDWCLDFVTRGGPALRAYPQYARVVDDPARAAEGRPRFRVASEALARTHRLGIGVITSDQSVRVVMGTGRSMGGSVLGHVEESFIARLNVGDVFTFAGRFLRLARVRDMTAFAQPASRRSGRVPAWAGARMPLSSELARALRELFARARSGVFDGPEMQAARPLLALQDRWSRLPVPGTLVVELARTREPSGQAFHAFVYPVQGRLVHEGLAALLAYRLARLAPRSLSMAANDYGLTLSSPEPFDAHRLVPAWRALLTTDQLADDLLACLNAGELTRRAFREIARVAGLIIPTFPGQRRSSRQTQASSDLFYDVLRDFDPGSLLLDQARREVLEKQLELTRLRQTLEQLAGETIVVVEPEQLTPLAFPLWADSLREQLSSEQWEGRIRAMLKRLEDAGG